MQMLMHRQAAAVHRRHGTARIAAVVHSHEQATATAVDVTAATADDAIGTAAAALVDDVSDAAIGRVVLVSVQFH